MVLLKLFNAALRCGYDRDISLWFNSAPKRDAASRSSRTHSQSWSQLKANFHLSDGELSVKMVYRVTDLKAQLLSK